MKTFSTLILAILIASTSYAGDLYLAYNIRLPRGSEGTFINYKTGDHLPAGTKATKIQINTTDTVSYLERDDYFKDNISFKANGKKISVTFEPRYHPSKSIKDYYETMFTPDPLDKRVDNEEIKAAILAGNIIVGMTKEQVIMSYGYPPEHKTPSLDANEWTYWRNRFGRKKICFDSNNLANKCTVAKPETKNIL